MGLDTTHDCWHGPYSSFASWRGELAKAAGRETDAEGDCTVVVDAYEWCNFQGLWRHEPEDALDVLLVHSDCDGYLFPHQLPRLAQRLEELLPSIGDEWRCITQRFIDGLRGACRRESYRGLDGVPFDEWVGQDIIQFR